MKNFILLFLLVFACYKCGNAIINIKKQKIIKIAYIPKVFINGENVRPMIIYMDSIEAYKVLKFNKDTSYRYITYHVKELVTKVKVVE